jgi:dienelactone hydrolase
MDYLCARPDVDPRRIAIVADGWASSFVARGIAYDDRFAAAVCDGGLWDLHERSFLTQRGLSRDTETEPVALRLGPSRLARNIKCPVLTTAGERGWLAADRVRQLHDALSGDSQNLTLKIFTADETGDAQGHADNPTLTNEFIFDWIEQRLDPARANAA